MRVILASYLRTLKERAELDRLVPELLLEMGYVPVAKAQVGPRQFGVDVAAVGRSADDGVDEMLLLVLKQGDIGRREWSDGQHSVRQSIEEILDVYLQSHIAPEHAAFRKVIVLATTGELKQEIQQNWAGFTEHQKASAEFRLWNGDKIAELLERYLLDEHLFASDDRTDLRRSLALAGERDSTFSGLLAVLRRQLGLDVNGGLTGPPSDYKTLGKAIRRAHLAGQICAHWAASEGERRQALWISERNMLWVWHRLQLQDEGDRARMVEDASKVWRSYQRSAHQYFTTIQRHLYVRDGFAGYCRESAEFAVVLFEHIGLIATIGLSQLLIPTGGADESTIPEDARVVADGLAALITNNEASGSPRLDENAIEISLALILLVLAGRTDRATEWLQQLARRLDFCFRIKRHFPIDTDSLDDLVDLEVDPDEERRESLMQMSWMLATVAAWCAVLRLDDVYRGLARSHATNYPKVCAQLWHPGSDWPATWYYTASHHASGHSEAPYALPRDPDVLRARLTDFSTVERFQWAGRSSARQAGIWALDFVACRHFRTPVPASAWYRFLDASEGTGSPGQASGRDE